MHSHEGKAAEGEERATAEPSAPAADSVSLLAVRSAPTPAAVLALQRGAGNRATAKVMRQVFPNKFTLPPVQTGPPRRLFLDEIVPRAKGHLGATLLKGEHAQMVLDDLNRVWPEDFQGAVDLLDAEGLIDLTIERLPEKAIDRHILVQVLKRRKPEKNKGLAKKLLSKGWFDWEVTDKDALAAAALIDALPEADRKEMLESWFGQELKTNLPGSPDYEPAIGRELVEGAILGDFDESPTGWSTLGQVAVGFIPIAGQVADFRDTVAILRKLEAAKWSDGWLWAQLVLTLIGWVPGLGDAVKALGRFALKWLRRSGKALVKPFFDALFKAAKPVIDAAFKKVIKPWLQDWLPKLRQSLREFFEKHTSKAAPAHPTTPKDVPHAPSTPKSGEAASGAGKSVKQLDDEAAAAVDKFGKGKGGGKAADDIVEHLAKGVVEGLKAWVSRIFKKALKMQYPYAKIDGEWLEIWGVGSNFRIMRVRIKTVQEYVVTKGSELLSLSKKRSGRLKEAAKATDDVAEAMFRSKAIQLTEEIGERVADLLVRAEFPGAKHVFTGKGSGIVDLVYEWGGKLIVVEAKGGASRLGFREIAPGIKAQQGTLAYLDDIIWAMSRRTSDSECVKMAARLKAARATKDGLLYVISKTGGLPAKFDAPMEKATLSYIRQ